MHFRNNETILADLLLMMIQASAELQQGQHLDRMNLHFDSLWLHTMPTLIELLDKAFDTDPEGYIAREIVPWVSSVLYHTGPGADIYFDKQRT